MGRSYHKRNRKPWKLTAGEFATEMTKVQPEYYARSRIILALILLLNGRIKNGEARTKTD